MKDWKFWVVAVLAVLVLGLNIANTRLQGETRDLRQALRQDSQFIGQSQQLSQLNNQFIRALASLSAQTNDESIRQILADNGVTFQVQDSESAQPGQVVAPQGDAK